MKAAESVIKFEGTEEDYFTWRNSYLVEILLIVALRRLDNSKSEKTRI